MEKGFPKHKQYTEEIQLFIRQNPQRRLSLPKLYTILELYEKWCTERCDSDPCERYVLHYIAERAFWSDVEDGEYVAKLLVLLHQVDKPFGFFLFPEEVFFFPPLMNLNEGHNCLAQFFLNHAYRQKLTIEGCRIVDLEVFCSSEWVNPCFSDSITPSLLQLLLQYGAMIISDEDIASRDPEFFPLTEYTLMTAFACFSLAAIKMYHEGSKISQKEFHAMVQYAKLIMRVIPHFEKIVISSALSQMELPADLLNEEAMNFITENYVPELRFRMYVPMTLKHACRLKVRMLLHRNFQLPHGIDELQIPVSLKSYLNLCCD